MTITTTTARVEYAGDGVSTEFAVPFAFFGSDELEVIERTIATGGDTVLVLGAAYTVAGGGGAAGTVTALAAPAATKQWIIRRKTKRTQEVDYVTGDPFPAETHERALDRLAAVDQDQDETIARGLRFPSGDSVAVNPELPSSVARASKLLGFDAAGQPVMRTEAVGGPALIGYAAINPVDDYEVIGDYTTDDTVAMQAAFTAAAAEKRNLELPPGYRVRITDTIDYGDGPSGGAIRAIRLFSPLVLDTAAYKPALTIGDPDVSGVVRVAPSFLWVERAAQVDWSLDTGTDAVGIRLSGLRESDIHVFKADKFTVGVQVNGGFAAAKLAGPLRLWPGVISNNQAAIEFYRAQDSSGNYGANEIVAIGGNIGCDLGVNAGQRRCGIRLRAPNGGNINAIRVRDMAVQLGIASPGDPLGNVVWFAGVRGEFYRNEFASLRGEFCSRDELVFIETAEAYENRFDFIWSNYPAKMVDRSSYPGTNSFRTRQPAPDADRFFTWSSGAVRERATAYTGSTYHVPNCGWAVANASVLQPNSSGTVTMAADGLLMGAGAGIGVNVDARQVKRWRLSMGVSGSPRVYVRPRGADGAPLDPRVPGTEYHAKRVRRVKILAAGSGGTAGTHAWNSSGGGASRAASGTLTISAGAVTAVTVADGGDGFTGQPSIVVDGSAGALTGFDAVFEFGHVRGSANIPFNHVDTYLAGLDAGHGACVMTPSANSAEDHIIAVSSEVASFDVILARVTSDFTLRAFGLRALQPGDADAGVRDWAQARDERIASAVPATLRSTYQTGETITRAAVAAGGYHAGWKVASAGTLGTLAATTASIRNAIATAVVDTGGDFATLGIGEWIAIAGGAVAAARIIGKRAIGQVPAWRANTAVSAGSACTNDSGKLYVCVGAGTTATSGGPTGTGTSIADGTATWAYVAAVANVAGTLTLSTTSGGSVTSQALTLVAPTFEPFGATYLSGTATYDPPSLAGGATQQTAVTVTGAAVGDFVLAVAHAQVNAGIEWSGQVTSANTVTVTQRNVSGAPIDLVSGVLAVRVQRA